MTTPRYKPYPAYKDSGIEWLGEIPAHWDLKRLRNCVMRLESGGTPESDNFEYWTNDQSGIPWVAISDMTRSFRVRDTSKRLTERGLRSKRLRILPAGTLLYSMYASLGKVALLEINATVNQAILGLVTREQLGSRDYLRWWLEFIQGHVHMLSSSNTQDNLNADKVRKMPVFVPNPDEQRVIAAFLDRETARIDALVAKKERLIELLQEQRTAFVTRAVTKGLDPTVPMKDSGVEWLGEIPVHWRLVPSTWLFAESKVRALETDEQLSATQKYGVIPQAEFERLEGRQVVHAFMHLHQRKHVEVNDFVMSMRSFEGGLERVRARGCVRSSYVVLRSSSEVHTGFFSHLFKSSAYVQALRATSNFIRDGQDLNFSNFRLVKLPLVSLREQEDIAAFLDRETARVDALVSEVRDAIDRLTELRTALISAAVTGKIDVRGAFAEASATQGGPA